MKHFYSLFRLSSKKLLSLLLFCAFIFTIKVVQVSDSQIKSNDNFIDLQQTNDLYAFNDSPNLNTRFFLEDHDHGRSSVVCDIGCDANPPVTHPDIDHTITFAGSEFDPVECKTYFYYCVDNVGSPQISHSTFGEHNCDATCLDENNITVGTWTIDDTTCEITRGGGGMPASGVDPTTNICGIKFDESVSGTAQYYICVDGNQTPGTVQFAIKAGPGNYYYEVPGPTDCEDNCDDCEQTAVCNLNDITENGCTIPDAFTDPEDVFTNIEACGAPVTMTYDDDGDFDLCGDGDAIDFVRTYSLLFDGQVFTTCEQRIIITNPIPSISTTAINNEDFGCNPTIIPPTFTVDDPCNSNAVANIQDNGILEDGCNRSQTWTASYTNGCDAAQQVEITYTWTVDTEAPSIVTNVQDKDLGCNPDTIAFDSPSFDGGCSDVVNVDGFPSTGDIIEDGCNRSQTKTWKVTDCSGLVTEVTQTLKWIVDTEAPEVVTGVQDKDLGCNPDTIAFDLPSFDGGCSDVVNVDGFPSTGDIIEDGCNRSQTKTWKVTDCSGLVTEVTQTLKWTVDTEAPEVVTGVQDKDLGCNPDTIAFDSPSFDGGCSDVVNVDGFPSTGDIIEDGCNRSQTKTWKVTDCSGLVTEVTQTLKWTVDTEAPSIVTNVQDKDLGCNPDTIAFDSPSFDGGCSDVVNVDGFPSTGDIIEDGCNRSQTKTWKVTDCSGLVTEVTQTLKWTVDTEAPEVVTGVQDKDLGCNPDTIAFDSPSFDGGCSDVINVDGFPSTRDIIEDGCNRSQTKTWKVTDCSGLVTEVTQTLKWTVDTEAPSIVTNVQDKDLGCNPDTIAFDSPSFDGGCSDVVNVDGFPSTGNIIEDGCNRSQTKIWKVTDCSGLVTEVTQTLKWAVDTEAPSIVTNVQDKDLGCNPDTIAFDSPSFDGGCSDVVNVDGFPSTGDIVEDGCNRSQTKTWKVTDCSGLVTEVTQTLKWVEDTEKPIISTYDTDKDLGCNPTVTPPNFTGTDNCDGPYVTFSPNISTDGPIANGCSYSQTWTASYTDTCDNIADEVSITYTWTVDTEKPKIICNKDNKIDLGCNPKGNDIPSGQSLIENNFITAEDNCDLDPKIELVLTEESKKGCKQFVTYYYRAIDDCGNITPKNEWCSVTFEWEVDDYKDCETAYALYQDSNICFLNDSDLNSNQWGWTNYFETPGSYTLDLYAGAAQCDINKGALVGTVTVDYTGSEVSVHYKLDAPYVMSEAQVNIGCDKYPLGNNNSYTVAPGQYNINAGTLDYVSSYSIGPVNVSGDGGIYVIAHAVVCVEVCRCSVSKDDGGTYTPSGLDVIHCVKEESLSNNSNTFDKPDFLVYPVPYKEIVFLEYQFNYETNIKIEVFDLKGSLITRLINKKYASRSKVKTSLDLSNLSDQIYLVKLTTNRGIAIKKIVSY